MKDKMHVTQSFELFVLHQHFSKQVDTALSRLHERIATAWDIHRQADLRLNSTRELMYPPLSESLRPLAFQQTRGDRECGQWH